MKLGKHKMLVVNQIDGVDGDGERVQVSLFQDIYDPKYLPFLKERQVKLWSQCIVSHAH
jgi:arginase family enzyme